MRYTHDTVVDTVFDPVRLKSLRLLARMTQQDLAIKAKLSVGTVSRLESGKVPDPHFRTLRQVARALRVPEEELEAHGQNKRG